MRKVDAEIRASSTSNTRSRASCIEDNRDKVEAMAKALLELETIDADQIDDIMAGKPPRPPKPTQRADTAGTTIGPVDAVGGTAPVRQIRRERGSTIDRLHQRAIKRSGTRTCASFCWLSHAAPSVHRDRIDARAARYAMIDHPRRRR